MSRSAQLDVSRVDVLGDRGNARVGDQHVNAVRMRSAHLSGRGLRKHIVAVLVCRCERDQKSRRLQLSNQTSWANATC